MSKDSMTARIDKLFRGLGNGDEEVASGILTVICVRLGQAREKHPLFAEGKFNALGVIESEFRELEYAIEHESEDRQCDEALDVIATCIRFLCGEHKTESKQ